VCVCVCVRERKLREREMVKVIYLERWNYYIIEINPTQCAKDCGPHNTLHANTGVHALMSVFMQLKLYFNVCALIFLISEVKGLTRPTKHANKIIILIFLTVMATILDAHGNFNFFFC